MRHKPVIQFLPGSDCAVLMIHGILGSPSHFDFLMPLIPENWSVYNILLDGHGGSAGDFGRTSMKKWKAQVADQLSLLRQRHKKILIVTHSMGGLFAIQEAVKDPEGIAGIFALAVALTPRVSLRGALSSVKAAFGWVSEKDPVTTAMRNDSSVELTRNVFPYIPWIDKFVALLWEARRTCAMVEKLNVPCHAVQSARDEMVSLRSCKVLKKNPGIGVTVMEHSGHFGYEEAEKEKVLACFSHLLGEL